MSEIAALPLSDSSAIQYLKFERERTRPVADLLAGVPSFDPQSCIDLGCGPGNSTELLVRRFPGSAIAGLDRSDDMLAAVKRRLPQVHFQRADLAVWKPDQPYGLIFANAVLQLLPNHEALFPWLASLLILHNPMARFCCVLRHCLFWRAEPHERPALNS